MEYGAQSGRQPRLSYGDARYGGVDAVNAQITFQARQESLWPWITWFLSIQVHYAWLVSDLDLVETLSQMSRLERKMAA